MLPSGRGQRLLRLLLWALVVLGLVATLLWAGRRSQQATLELRLQQYAEQLVIQSNLARGRWLLAGRPQPLPWAPVGADSPLPLWFSAEGQLSAATTAECEALWLALLRLPLQFGRGLPITVNAAKDQRGEWCRYQGGDWQLQWWPASGQQQVISARVATSTTKS